MLNADGHIVATAAPNRPKIIRCLFVKLTVIVKPFRRSESHFEGNPIVKPKMDKWKRVSRPSLNKWTLENRQRRPICGNCYFGEYAWLRFSWGLKPGRVCLVAALVDNCVCCLPVNLIVWKQRIPCLNLPLRHTLNQQTSWARSNSMSNPAFVIWSETLAFGNQLSAQIVISPDEISLQANVSAVTLSCDAKR